MAKAEQLKPLELELRKLEDLSESIVQDFVRMKKIEQEHRDTNRLWPASAPKAKILISETQLV